ncbi:hypothetical protein EG265_05020 [Neisseria gonorrhoeae]
MVCWKSGYYYYFLHEVQERTALSRLPFDSGQQKTCSFRFLTKCRLNGFQTAYGQ